MIFPRLAIGAVDEAKAVPELACREQAGSRVAAAAACPAAMQAAQRRGAARGGGVRGPAAGSAPGAQSLDQR